MPPQMRTEALEREREPTRARILAAAADLFSRLGYEGTTVKDIARKCQLTDPALYYHFNSKRDILTALLVEPPLADIPLDSPANPTREALAEDLCRIFDFWSGYAGTLRLLYRHALEGDEETRALGRQLSATYEGLIMPPLRQIYSGAAERIYPVLSTLLTGVQLDALIAHGHDYAAEVAAPAFRERLHRLVDAALPPAHIHPEAV